MPNNIKTAKIIPEYGYMSKLTVLKRMIINVQHISAPLAPLLIDFFIYNAIGG